MDSAVARREDPEVFEMLELKCLSPSVRQVRTTAPYWCFFFYPFGGEGKGYSEGREISMSEQHLLVVLCWLAV